MPTQALRRPLVLLGTLVLIPSLHLSGQEAKPAQPQPVQQVQAAPPADSLPKPAAGEAAAEPALTPEQAARYAKFAERMSGVKLVGHFTVVGRDNPNPRAESYTIQSVKHVSGNMWMFKTRVQYGDKDVTLPMLLPIEWAGETPMISMTDFNIPLLGTFSARVVFDDGKYAGTWKHDQVSGHLYGIIEPLSKPAAENAPPAPKPDADNNK